MATHSAKRTRTLALLSIVFVGLVGAIAWMELGEQQQPTQIANTDINNISITRDGFDDINLVRSNDSWQMSAPYALKANDQRLEPLLMIGTAQLEGYEQSDVDMVAAGLNDPGASIRIGERDVLLGNTDIDGERRYALVDGKVSFLPEWVWSLVHGGVSAFADLTIFQTLQGPLYLIDEKSAQRISNPINNIDQWLDLRADKISAPYANLEAGSAGEIISTWWLSSTKTKSDETLLAKITQLDTLTLISTEPGFSYAISNNRLEALLNGSIDNAAIDSDGEPVIEPISDPVSDHLDERVGSAERSRDTK